jgi:CRP-like cAMP-binding protein
MSLIDYHRSIDGTRQDGRLPDHGHDRDESGNASDRSGSARMVMAKDGSAPNRATGRAARAGGGLLDTRRMRAVLGRSPHSSTLPGEFLDRLARLGRIERYKDGELVHAAWRPVDKLWVVLSGGLRVSLLGRDGSGFTVAVLGEGSYYSTGSILREGEVVNSEAHAVGSTHVAVFDVTQLEREFAGDKVMDRHRMELLYRRFLSSSDFYRDLLNVPLPQRLARRLLSQALAAGREPEIELHVSQAELAAMLRASRSKVNAELHRLEEAAALRLGYRKIVVCDLELLRAAAGTEVVPL